jgi:3-hydroxyacyl-CoA dehydrogenase
MGRAIAAHLANAGLDVLLLDIVPSGVAPGASRHERNALALQGIAALTKDRPAPLYDPAFATRIEAGNLEDDLHRLAEVDWVIEVVIERLDIKHSLLERLGSVCGPTTIISSNTSGIPISVLAEALPEEVRTHFLGTHFFNPPRYMHLLEIIPGPTTNPEVVRRIEHLAQHYLGKGVILAKDRPNFVANRIGTYGILRSVQLMHEQGLNPTEVDALTGPLVGRPKSATFRTVDLVGLDTLLHVANNVREGAPDDPEISTFEPPELLVRMVRDNLVGAKAGAGFYRKVMASGGSSIEALDPDSFEYRAKPKVRFPELEPIRAIESLPERLQALVNTGGRGADYAWSILRDTLRYAASVAGEIADDLVTIDRAMRWGFGWELGPFQMWDLLGMRQVADRMDAEDRAAPQWVRDQLDRGAERFYELSPEGEDVLSLNGQRSEVVPLPARHLPLQERPTSPRRIESNQGASLWDLGDDVIGLEFHSKMNSIGGDILQLADRATRRAEDGFAAMVVGNQGSQFSVGANVALLLLAALEGEYDEIDLMVRQFQRMTMGLRECRRPVVVAPFSLSLGGGCEITLHADRVVASAELYMGLVEGGVGLIPAGGGTKELYLRMLERLGPEADPRTAARQAFETIGLAKVSTSAHEARKLGFLRDGDSIVPNPNHLLQTAKEHALTLARAGYQPPRLREQIPVGGADVLALLEVGLVNLRGANRITDHEMTIGRKLAHVLSGGAHRSGPAPRSVSEQQLLDLEREAFLQLCGERKTLERIQHMLKTGKPLRN